jgi:putative DNA primase/helicase
MAADSLIKRAKATGIFDHDMIRGRGAWWDGGKVAVHLGDRVVIDGETYGLKDAPSEYVYEAAHARRIAVGPPLPTSAAVQLVQICESLRWDRPISGILLAGWVFLAPVCGALEWRPHIWVTGGKGSGKSTVMKDIVGKTLNGNMLFVQGDTSEAGVRQELGQDAIPVLFDEFESERRKSAERTEDVLSLVTAASSETGAVIAKGGATGKATKFKIRSMFAFSGISVQIKQAAAISRITVLSMKSAGDESEDGLKHYQQLMQKIRTTLTPDYIDGLQSRAVQMIPVIRKNAQVFAEAAAVVLGTRRQGDQIGTLLAGAYALHSNSEVTPEFAKQWLESRDWTDEREDSESTDEMMCLQHILTHQLIIHSDTGAVSRRTIGELVSKMISVHSDFSISQDEAGDTLERHGLKFQERETGSVLIIANRHKMLDDILRDKPWAPPAHARVLLRLRGARKTEGPEYFKGARQRGVEIPVAHLL